MSLLSLSTSAAPNSVNYRGLLVLNELIDMGTIDGLHKYNIPVINVNGMEEVLPPEVDRLIKNMHKFDRFIFTVPEV